jgi:hypothetical protein
MPKPCLWAVKARSVLNDTRKTTKFSEPLFTMPEAVRRGVDKSGYPVAEFDCLNSFQSVAKPIDRGRQRDSEFSPSPRNQRGCDLVDGAPRKKRSVPTVGTLQEVGP